MQELMNCTNPVILRNNTVYKCGKCQLCRRSKMMEWKARAVHELIEQKKALFITLTYAPKNLPKCDPKKFVPMCSEDKGGNLNSEDVVKFIKRLRKHFKNIKLKYIYCGEYGGLRKRPHYHMILYGLDYAPEIKAIIQEKWGLGYVDIDTQKVSTRAIQYVLGYVRKKIGDIQDDEIYNKIGRIKPFQRQSNGIGKLWAEKNRETWVHTGSICIDSFQQPVPRYYVKRLFEDEGTKVKYVSRTRYIYETDEVSYSTQSYKILPNLDKTLTRKVFLQRQKAPYESIITLQKKYQEFFYNIPYFRKQYFNDAKYRIKTARKEYATYLYYAQKETHNYENDALREAFSKNNIKNRTIDTNRFEKLKYIDFWIIDENSQKKMRNIAQNKEYELLASPFGKRNGIDFETIEEIAI